jgi:hypothetical protein
MGALISTQRSGPAEHPNVPLEFNKFVVQPPPLCALVDVLLSKVVVSWHTLISTLGRQHLVLVKKVVVLFPYTNKDKNH